MLNYDYTIKLAELRSSQESFNGNVKGGVVAEYVPESFFVLEVQVD